MSHAVTTDVLDVLRTVEWDGPVAKITAGQLDRKLYLAVNKVLEGLGGKWKRKLGGHAFEASQADALDAVIDSGEFVDPKKHFGYFQTPEALADEVVAAAEISGHHTVLEPSAGGGRLVAAVRRALPGGETITAVELDGSHMEKLDTMYGNVTVEPGDFLRFSFGGFLFDRIVMNPPYGNQADIEHVMHAWDCLAPGGRIVALMGAGWTFRENRKSRDFRAFVAAHGSYSRLPEGAFEESGTMVRAVQVTLDNGAPE